MTVQGCPVGFLSDVPLHRIRRYRMDYGFTALYLKNPHRLCERFSQDTVLFSPIETSAIAGGVTMLTAPGPVGRTARFFGPRFYRCGETLSTPCTTGQSRPLGRVRPPREPRRETNVILDEKMR